MKEVKTSFEVIWDQVSTLRVSKKKARDIRAQTDLHTGVGVLFVCTSY